MPIYRDELMPDSVRNGYSPSDPLRCIHRLALELSQHDGLERLMPKAFACLAPAISLHSVTIIEAYGSRKSLRIWFDNDTSLACIRESLASARTSYCELGDPAETFHSDDEAPKLLRGRYEGVIRQTEIKIENRLILPLACGPRTTFGILQIETNEPVGQDEALMTMFSLLAARVACAIDRDSLVHTQRKLLSVQYSANVKLMELEHQRSEAVSATLAKSSFLANMSHEIRTPLGIILGFSDLLCAEDIPLGEREIFQRTIKKNGQLLAKLIDDILDLSKIEEGKIELEFKEFVLSELLSDIEANFATRAKEKGIYFHILADDDLPARFTSDPFRLKQILINVVNNAIKFTDHGGVTMEVKYSNPYHGPGSAPEHLLRFEVRDTGLGICADEARKIFQPFMQANTTTASRFGGTGLGLVLARRLANELGGDVKLKESSPGEGSLFEVTIGHPKTLLTQPEPTPLCEKDRLELMMLKGSHILIADDAADNLLLFSTVLRAQGADVDTAVNGFEAVEKALSKSYDIVLLDLQMPIKDGFTAAHELRTQGFAKPILALTAMAMAEEKAKALKAGCNDHLSKPVNAEQLINKILQLAEWTNKDPYSHRRQGT